MAVLRVCSFVTCVLVCVGFVPFWGTGVLIAFFVAMMEFLETSLVSLRFVLQARAGGALMWCWGFKTANKAAHALTGSGPQLIGVEGSPA